MQYENKARSRLFPRLTFRLTEGAVLGVGFLIVAGLAILGIVQATGSSSWNPGQTPLAGPGSGNVKTLPTCSNGEYIISDGSWWGCDTASPAPLAYSTKLLIHSDTTNGSTTFTDSSYSAHTVTANADTKHSTTQSKFGATSIYFDGTGDYLTIPGSNDWDFDGDFTIDFWGYKSGAGDNFLFSVPGDSLYYLGMNWAGTNYVTLNLPNGMGNWGDIKVDGDYTGAWHHFALVRNSGVIKGYMDGVQMGIPITNSSTISTNGTFLIGKRDDGYSFEGYIDEFRISKSIARWTSSFIPPTNTYSSDTSAKLLVHSDTTNNSTTFTDSGDTGHTVTAHGNAKHKTTQSKFGATSIYFDGTGDYLSVPNSADWAFGTGDFTIDFWYFADSPHTEAEIFNIAPAYNSESSNTKIKLLKWQDEDAITFSVYPNYIKIGVSFDARWHHLAAIRQNGILRGYFDGVQDINSIPSGQALSSDNLFIGSGNHAESHVPTTRYWRGYIDEFRISKGIARWTGGFTPPTTAYDHD